MSTPTAKRQPPLRRRAADPAVVASRSGSPPRALGAFPPLRALLDVRGPYLLPIVLLVVTRVAFALLVPRGAEDAFITYRYARNLATGAGLVYNPGQHVMGFSSPVWAVWNALGYALIHDPLLWSRATSLVADVATLLVTATLLTRHASVTAARCFAFFFAVWPYFTAISMSGLETATCVALIPLAAALAAERSVMGGPALAALALIRPEGLVAAAVVSLGARARERIVALVLVLAGLGALAATFGTIVPQSLAAKLAVYGAPGPWAGRGWWEWLLPFPLGRWPELPDTVMIVPLAVVLSPAVIVGAAALGRAPRTPLAVTVAAALVVWAGYAALGVSFFWWYLAVPLAGFAIVAAVGLPRLAGHRALYVSLALLVVGIWTMARFLYAGRAEQDSRTFDGVAAFLKANARAGDSVLLEPIGFIGWSAPVVVVDEVGLVSPQVAERRRGGPGWYTDVVSATRPDWLVMRYGMLSKGSAFAGRGAPFRDAAERDSLLVRYHAVAQGEEKLGENSLVVLQRTRGRPSP